MRRRRRRVAARCGLTLLVAAGLAGCGKSAQPAPAANLGTALDTSVPASVLTAPLQDQDGKRTTLASLKGETVVLADGMTLCQEVCPLTAANLVQLARSVPAQAAGKVAFVLLTVDPERDTPGRLAAYRQLFAPAPQAWLTLTGSPRTVDAIWHYFGVSVVRVPEADSPAPKDWLTGRPLSYDIQHSDMLVFLGADQHEKFLIVGGGNVQGRALPLKLGNFLSPAGKTNRTDPDPYGTWTTGEVWGVLEWMTNQRLEPGPTG